MLELKGALILVPYAAPAVLVVIGALLICWDNKDRKADEKNTWKTKAGAASVILGLFSLIGLTTLISV